MTPAPEPRRRARWDRASISLLDRPCLLSSATVEGRPGGVRRLPGRVARTAMAAYDAWLLRSRRVGGSRTVDHATHPGRDPPARPERGPLRLGIGVRQRCGRPRREGRGHDGSAPDRCGPSGRHGATLRRLRAIPPRATRRARGDAGSRAPDGDAGACHLRRGSVVGRSGKRRCLRGCLPASSHRFQAGADHLRGHPSGVARSRARLRCDHPERCRGEERLGVAAADLRRGGGRTPSA